MKTIRAFIAIHLSEVVKVELGQISQVLSEQLPPKSVRWVKPEQIHLTLRFLGDTAVSQLPTLSAELDRLCSQYTPFKLQLGETGCFPNPRRPRVIWVSLKEASNKLASLQVGSDELPLHPLFALQAEIETAVAQLGWQKEDKPFHAHLTLGRVNDGYRLDGNKWQVTVKPLPMTITAVHLIESQLQPSGPIYTIKHTGKFNLLNQ